LSKRIIKKLNTPFEVVNPTAALLLVNLQDPQLQTLKVFMKAIVDYDLHYFAVGNKADLVTEEQIEKIKKEFEIMMTDLPGTHRIWFLTSCKTGDGIDFLKKSMTMKFGPGERILVLGIFNSGKTSMIRQLLGKDVGITDVLGEAVPGKTQTFDEYLWDDRILIDSVGQVIDITKPLMFSIDFTDCKTPEEKIERVFKEEISGLSSSFLTSKNAILEAVELLKTQIEKGKKVIVLGAGASALVAKEMAGQGTETGVPIVVYTNDLAEASPVSFAKGIAEEERGLARYGTLVINEGDVCIGISASGGTGFVFEALRLAKEKKAKTISITENADTPLGKYSDIIIKSEAKPEGPSSSKIQTAHLVIGHALMLLLAEVRGMTAEKSIEHMMPEKCANKKMGIK